MSGLRKLVYALLATAIVAPVATVVSAELTKDQQTCIDAYNNMTRLVSQQAGTSARNCIKNAGKGKEANPDTCIVTNTDGKIALKEAKVSALYSSPRGKCTGGEPIQQGAATGNAAHHDALTNLAHDIFGTPVAGVVNPGKNEAKCQDTATLRAAQLFTAEVKGFRNCKKDQMKAGTVSDSTTLAAHCMTPQIPDPKNAIDAKAKKLIDQVSKNCTGLPVALFAGLCKDELTIADVASCIEERTNCRLCLALNAADGMANNCDLFDNGSADISCP